MARGRQRCRMESEWWGRLGATVWGVPITGAAPDSKRPRGAHHGLPASEGVLLCARLDGTPGRMQPWLATPEYLHPRNHSQLTSTQALMLLPGTHLGSRHPPGNRHPPSTRQAPNRHPRSTHQAPTRHPPGAHQAPNFPSQGGRQSSRGSAAAPLREGPRGAPPRGLYLRLGGAGRVTAAHGGSPGGGSAGAHQDAHPRVPQVRAHAHALDCWPAHLAPGTPRTCPLPQSSLSLETKSPLGGAALEATLGTRHSQ